MTLGRIRGNIPVAVVSVVLLVGWGAVYSICSVLALADTRQAKPNLHHKMGGKRQPLENATTGSRVEAKKIVALQLQGRGLMKKEDSIRRQREAVFSSAAIKLQSYIAKWDTNTKSVSYLRDIYRLALYYKFADQRDLAIHYLDTCLQLPQRFEPGAIYGKPPRPIRDLVAEDLSNLRPSRNPGPPFSVQYGTTDGTTFGMTTYGLTTAGTTTTGHTTR